MSPKKLAACTALAVAFGAGCWLIVYLNNQRKAAQLAQEYVALHARINCSLRYQTIVPQAAAAANAQERFVMQIELAEIEKTCGDWHDAMVDIAPLAAREPEVMHEGEAIEGDDFHWRVFNIYERKETARKKLDWWHDNQCDPPNKQTVLDCAIAEKLIIAGGEKLPPRKVKP